MEIVVEPLNDMWKAFEKQIQTVFVRTIGRAVIRKKNRTHKKINNKVKTETFSAKNSILSATTGLQETIKGKFGDRITEALDEKTHFLEELIDS